MSSKHEFSKQESESTIPIGIGCGNTQPFIRDLHYPIQLLMTYNIMGHLG